MKLLLASLSASFLLLTACGDGDEVVLPELEAGWTEFQPGGDTTCARETPFAYYVRKGSVNKLIVDFIGGGACWNAGTCRIGDALFQDSVDSVRERIEGNEPTGFYDDRNPANPFKDWYHVVVPYCTGDVHWGNSVSTYEDGQGEVVIHHKGAVNARAVLDWVYANFSAPEQIMVTGCSAGAYGSALWAAYVMQHYPGSNVFQFGDSGAGVITETFFQDSFPSWKAEEAFPTFIPSLDPNQNDIMDSHLPDLYAGVAEFFPDRWTSQYNTVRDENQYFFYAAMGGGPIEEWTQQMLASVEEIESRAQNFSAFIAPGEQHCILPYDNFYTVEANGTKLVDWLAQLIEEGSAPSAKCQGAECDGDTP